MKTLSLIRPGDAMVSMHLHRRLILGRATALLKRDLVNEIMEDLTF